AVRPVSHHGGDHPVRNLADAIVASVGDVQVASRVQGDAVGPAQRGIGSRTVVAHEARSPVSSHDGDHPVRNLADAIATLLGDVEVASRVHRDGYGTPQPDAGGRTTVDVKRAAPRHGGDHAIRHLADASVSSVGDVQVAGSVHRDTPGTAQLSAGGWAVVATEAWRPGPRHGRDHSVRYLTDAVVKTVGNVQVAARGHRDANGKG